MPFIHTLKISNFRGIQNFEHVFGASKFICLIGRGDSGKSTILEAISYVLYPNWNLTFYDTDFYKCDVEKPIEIEATLYKLPDNLLREEKYGLHQRFMDRRTGSIQDEPFEDDTIKVRSVLTIKLKVSKDLEPRWYVVNSRQAEPIEIKSSDRASLNVYMVSDYIDKHFSWGKGNPLYSILKEESNTIDPDKVILNAMREAKSIVDVHNFEDLNTSIEKIKENAAKYGIDISAANTTIDFKDIHSKDGKLYLHDDNIPFRQKGKGSKRLISIAIQTELVKSGGIILIDEIEQGLEPDRVQHLAQTLKANNSGQIFLTTHSRDVLVELEAKDLFKIKKNEKKLYAFGNDLQGLLRSNSDAFFAERILVCEGATEVGICRGLNEYRINNGKVSATFRQVRFTDGKGANMIEYAKGFQKSGYDVCLFCDSDDSNINVKKSELKNIKIIDCANGNAVENQIFHDLPWEGIKELINYRIEEKGEQSTLDSVKSKYIGTFPVTWQNKDTPEMRKALGLASVVKDKDWFKRTDHGEFLGKVCCKYLSEMEDNRLKQQIEELSKWIDNA